MELSYERRGAGEPLVLIHGLGGSQRVWCPVLDRLAKQREVIAVDMPGAGGSAALADGVRPTPATLGAAISDFCDRLGHERPHVAGNSLGGWVALEIAKAGRAASVCAISPAGLWPRPLGPRSFDSHRLGRRLRPLLPVLLASPRVRDRLLSSTLAHPDRISKDEARGLIEDWIDAPAYEATNRELRTEVYEHAELVTVPTTIAWGTKDRLIRPPLPERMPPGARYVVLEGLGHTPTWDDPELVASLLLDASGSPTQPATAAQFS